MIKQVVFFHILLDLWRSNYLDPWCSLSFFISRNICSYSSLKSTTTAFTDIHRLLVHYNIIWSAPLSRKYFLKWNYSMTAVMPRVHKRLWLNNKPIFFWGPTDLGYYADLVQVLYTKWSALVMMRSTIIQKFLCKTIAPKPRGTMSLMMCFWIILLLPLRLFTTS